MITSKHAKIVFTILSIVLISIPILAEAEDPVKSHHPLPVFELEKVITGWLEHSGYKVSRAPLQMGKVQIKAVKEKKGWQISLAPHSALATELQAKCTAEGKPDEAQLERLRDHIEGYLSGNSKANSIETEAPRQFIPTAVLSQAESVVCLRAEFEDDDMQFSGFIVDEDGLIISTAHGLKGIEQLTVILSDGRQFKGNLIKMDLRRDLAFVDIKGKFDSYIPVANGRNLLGMGEQLYSIGCPINLGGTVYTGIINSPPRRVNGLPLWQVDMEIHPGSSGSPVFDVQGNLVAVVKGRYRGTDSVGFLIPFETIMEFAKD
jgi:serine protease Do